LCYIKHSSTPVGRIVVQHNSVHGWLFLDSGLPEKILMHVVVAA